MSGRRVLAPGNLDGAAVDSGWLDLRVKPGGKLAAGIARRETEPQPLQIGQMQRAGTQAFGVAAAVHASSGDVAERVGAHVAELGRIGRATCPDRVEHEQECPRHCCNFLTKNVP